MERKALSKLITWKNSKNRKPLIIEGARQVGKTWLMKEFGNICFEKSVYINFENNSRLRNIFEQDFDLKRIILLLSAETGISITPENTLIIFDEIQEAPKALSSLKYFYELAPEYAIVGAGSLLGIALHHETSFPVGKVDFLKLSPLSYREFLLANNEKALVEILDTMDPNTIQPMKSKFIERLKEYYFVGGMPEAVLTFTEENDFNKVRQVQKNLLNYYEQDFSKHAPVNQIPRLNLVWNSIPRQLSKENRKFIYGQLRTGARAKDFEIAIQWLKDCGLIHLVHNVSKPGYPLKSYEEMDSFKIYLNDIGLLCAMGDIDISSILDENKFFTEFKGAITEQYVLQELSSNCDIPVYYYSTSNSSGEIDFLTQIENRIIPIEVKAAENLQAKSLKAFHQKWQNEISVRTSLSDFRIDDWLTNIPLYEIGLIEKIVPDFNSFDSGKLKKDFINADFREEMLEGRY
ncbi:MAG: ATP-binding protein [Treponema sp.]|nr:ATP-binding protein [Treponema sp.]